MTKKLLDIVGVPMLLLEKDDTLLVKLQAAIASVTEKMQPSIKMGDALLFDAASELDKIAWKTSETIVVGNLPYYITSPLLTKFF